MAPAPKIEVPSSVRGITRNLLRNVNFREKSPQSPWILTIYSKDKVETDEVQVPMRRSAIGRLPMVKKTPGQKGEASKAETINQSEPRPHEFEDDQNGRGPEGHWQRSSEKVGAQESTRTGNKEDSTEHNTGLESAEQEEKTAHGDESQNRKRNRDDGDRLEARRGGGSPCIGEEFRRGGTVRRRRRTAKRC